MHNDLFTELSIIVAIGAIISLFMRLIKQPLIIGYILTGLVVGPTVFDLVTSGETLKIFSDMGIALLLFLVGLGLNPKVIKEVGKIATLTGIGQVVFTTIIGYLLILLITPLRGTAALYVSIALAFSSTIIILKLLSDKKEQNRLHGKIATGFLLIQDIIATFALLVVSANGSGGLKAGDLLTLVGKGIAIGVALFIVVKFVLPLFVRTITGSQELLFLFSIAWGIGIGAIFKWAGFSLEIGALVAGVALAQFSFAQEAGSRLKPLRDFFVVLFFVVLGSHLDLSNIIDVLPQAIMLSGFVLIGNPLIVMIIMGLSGYTKKTSFKTSLAVAQISEFSLVLLLLAKDLEQVDARTLSLVTVVGLITIAVSSYAILYDNQIYNLIEKYLGIFEKKRILEHAQKTTDTELMLFGYHKGGSEIVKAFDSIGKRYVVVDYDPEVIERLEKRGIPYIYGDMTDPELLDESGVSYAKLVVSVVTDIEVTKSMINYVNQVNPRCVIICHADNVSAAQELYALGVSYVMMPHFIGSEQIGSLIKRKGLSKAVFREYRRKHQRLLIEGPVDDVVKEHAHIGHAVLAGISKLKRDNR